MVEGTIRLRCKTSMQAKVWYPEAAERNNDKGVALLDPSAPRLPTLGVLPQRAEFTLPFKRQDEITRTILGMREKHPQHMTAEQHEEWEQFFSKLPRGVQDVAKTDVPAQTLLPRSPLADARTTPPNAGPRRTDRSDLDVAERPLVPSLTHAGFTAAARQRAIQDRQAGWEDATGASLEPRTYAFVRSSGCVTDYRLPIDLVYINKVSDDKQTAQVTYQQEFGGYMGHFRSWLPATARGQAYYKGEVSKESVVVFNVPRTGSGVHKAYKLSATFLKKLNTVSEGAYTHHRQE